MGNTKPIGVAYADPDLDGATVSNSALSNCRIKGALLMAKTTGTLPAPGAGMAVLYAIPGSVPGTAQLVMLAGTSNTPVQIIDGVGANF